MPRGRPKKTVEDRTPTPVGKSRVKLPVHQHVVGQTRIDPGGIIVKTCLECGGQI